MFVVVVTINNMARPYYAETGQWRIVCFRPGSCLRPVILGTVSTSKSNFKKVPGTSFMEHTSSSSIDQPTSML